MGKHGNEYERVARDLYPTPPWPVDALGEHVNLRGRALWEFAAGTGAMVAALKAAGAASVYASGIVNHGYSGLDEVFDFLSTRESPAARFDGLVTNPPYGSRGQLAEAFIEAGLRRLPSGGFLALLLPHDFDAAKSRVSFFQKCPLYTAKIVLTRRIVWFERHDGKREAPKENSAFFIWSRGFLLTRQPPVVLYAGATS
jgi:hypothetical protein